MASIRICDICRERLPGSGTYYTGSASFSGAAQWVLPPKNGKGRHIARLQILGTDASSVIEVCDACLAEFAEQLRDTILTDRRGGTNG